MKIFVSSLNRTNAQRNLIQRHKPLGHQIQIFKCAYILFINELHMYRKMSVWSLFCNFTLFRCVSSIKTLEFKHLSIFASRIQRHVLNTSQRRQRPFLHEADQLKTRRRRDDECFAMYCIMLIVRTRLHGSNGNNMQML